MKIQVLFITIDVLVIIMMHQGMIDEVGTHEELIDKKGRYYALYRQQGDN